MKVLVACEESQAVCIAFRNKGHEAYSCDILPCSGGHPEWHLQDDVLKVLGGPGFDLMLAFPPCTDLAVSGAAWFERKRKDGSQQRSIDFFMALVNADIPKIAIENPVGIMSTVYRKPDQVIQPWQFGDGAGNDNVIECSEYVLQQWNHNFPIKGMPELGIIKRAEENI